VKRHKALVRITGIIGVASVAVAALTHGINHDIAVLAIFVIAAMAGYLFVAQGG